MGFARAWITARITWSLGMANNPRPSPNPLPLAGEERRALGSLSLDERLLGVVIRGAVQTTEVSLRTKQIDMKPCTSTRNTPASPVCASDQLIFAGRPALAPRRRDSTASRRRLPSLRPYWQAPTSPVTLSSRTRG